VFFVNNAEQYNRLILILIKHTSSKRLPNVFNIKGVRENNLSNLFFAKDCDDFVDTPVNFV